MYAAFLSPFSDHDSLGGGPSNSPPLQRSPTSLCQDTFAVKRASGVDSKRRVLPPLRPPPHFKLLAFIPPPLVNSRIKPTLNALHLYLALSPRRRLDRYRPESLQKKKRPYAMFFFFTIFFFSTFYLFYSLYFQPTLRPRSSLHARAGT